MAEPQAQRLFFALWPKPETAHQIWRATANLVPSGVGRRLPAKYIHLTLAFLGSLDAAGQQCCIQAADRLHAEGFALSLDQPGCFPGPQVVWLGPTRIPPALQVLQTKLVNQLNQECGYKPEARLFVPHVTLWRKVRRAVLPPLPEPISWPVSHFVLACSRTMPNGAEYAVLRTWSLGAKLA